MHYERFAFKRCVVGRSRDHRSGVGFSAELFQFSPKDSVGWLGLRVNTYYRNGNETRQDYLLFHKFLEVTWNRPTSVAVLA